MTKSDVNSEKVQRSLNENFKRKLVSFAQHNRSVKCWPVFPTCNSRVYYLDLRHTITPYLENKHSTKPAGRYILTVNNEGSPTFWSDGHGTPSHGVQGL